MHDLPPRRLPVTLLAMESLKEGDRGWATSTGVWKDDGHTIFPDGHPVVARRPVDAGEYGLFTVIPKDS